MGERSCLCNGPSLDFFSKRGRGLDSLGPGILVWHQQENPAALVNNPDKLKRESRGHTIQFCMVEEPQVPLLGKKGT
jgi:hypothetical protein